MNPLALLHPTPSLVGPIAKPQRPFVGVQMGERQNLFSNCWLGVSLRPTAFLEDIVLILGCLDSQQGQITKDQH